MHIRFYLMCHQRKERKLQRQTNKQKITTILFIKSYVPILCRFTILRVAPFLSHVLILLSIRYKIRRERKPIHGENYHSLHLLKKKMQKKGRFHSMLLQQNTIKAQKQDIRVDGKSTRTKKYISTQV